METWKGIGQTKRGALVNAIQVKTDASGFTYTVAIKAKAGQPAILVSEVAWFIFE